MTPPAAAARNGNPCVYGPLTQPQQQPAKKPVTCKAEPKPAFQNGNPQSALKSNVLSGKKPAPTVSKDAKPTKTNTAKVTPGKVEFSDQKITAVPKPKDPKVTKAKAQKVVDGFGGMINVAAEDGKKVAPSGWGKTDPKRAAGSPSKAAGPQKK